MGKNAVVSVYLKNILPINPIKERYPNTYRQERCHFIVGDIKKVKVACRKGEEVIIVVTLKFKDSNEDPRTDVSPFDYHWFVRYFSCRLDRPGPPNQLFFVAGQKRKATDRRIQPARCRNQQNDNAVPENMVSDPESDVESVQVPPTDPNESDRYYVAWEESFQDHITIDNRQLRGCNKYRASLSGLSTGSMEYMSAANLFMMLSPKDYFEDHLLPDTNRQLEEMNEKVLSLGEFYV